MGVEIRTQPKPKKVMDFNVELVDLTKLVPHEMTIEHALESFKYAVQFDGVVKHPIVLDKSTLLILDGHHRHAGLLALGFKSAPAILIDYLDDNLVSLDTWYPKIRKSIRDVILELENEDLEVDECLSPMINFDKVRTREVTAIIGNSQKHWTLLGDRGQLFRILREKWLNEIIYYDDPIRCVKDTQPGETAVISWSFTKNEILEHVKQGKIFLPKTTRHTIHYLYKDCNYPLEELPRVIEV